MLEIENINKLLHDLYPICRSLTGNGNRETLDILKEYAPLEIFEVPSGKEVFDWTIPNEWNVRDAWVKDSQGKKIIDFKESNVHLVSYSEPFEGTLSFEELEEKLHYLENLPDAIPYRTTYYKRDWGFCLSCNQFKSLDRTDHYSIMIDSDLNSNGSLTYAQAIKRGESDKEILLSTYCCHPSLVNDNLSGVITATLLFKYISTLDTHFTYRLLITPETIGVITFLSEHYKELENIVAGAVLTTTGGPGKLGMKECYDTSSMVNQAAVHALNKFSGDWIKYPFKPDGSDERQYCTPGIRIPTVTITKDKYYEYPEYHTSLDNLNFVKAENINKTLEVYKEWFHILEMNMFYKRTLDCCEFQLGKRGLYPQTGGAISQSATLGEGESIDAKKLEGDFAKNDILAMNWIMFACDGQTSLLELAERSGLDLEVLDRNAKMFLKNNLLTIEEHT